MKILIVEDQEEKSEDIVNFFKHKIEHPKINIKRSLRSGLKEVITSDDYDIIILDMSMPNFDPSKGDPSGGTPESFAGKELLAQMDLRGILTPVIVVTQYATFSKGQIALEELDNLFKKSYSNFYLGAVFYSSVGSSWKIELQKLLNKLD